MPKREKSLIESIAIVSAKQWLNALMAEVFQSLAGVVWRRRSDLTRKEERVIQLRQRQPYRNPSAWSTVCSRSAPDRTRIQMPRAVVPVLVVSSVGSEKPC